MEKPIAYNSKKLDQIKNDKIFVGYNRIFYKTVNYIKSEYVKKIMEEFLSMLFVLKLTKKILSRILVILYQY